MTATVTYDEPTKTATLTPSAPLAGNLTYTATVTTGATGAAGSVAGLGQDLDVHTSALPVLADGRPDAELHRPRHA